MHAVEKGIVVCDIFFTGGRDSHVWQFVTEGESQIKSKSVTYFLNGPQIVHTTVFLATNSIELSRVYTKQTNKEKLLHCSIIQVAYYN